jgi:hypothetical protein
MKGNGYFSLFRWSAKATVPFRTFPGFFFFAGVTQLAREPAFQAGGRRFKSGSLLSASGAGCGYFGQKRFREVALGGSYPPSALTFPGFSFFDYARGAGSGYFSGEQHPSSRSRAFSFPESKSR